MRDEPEIDLCWCDRYKFWYFDDGIYVCACGHPDSEHIEGHFTCTGRMTVNPKEASP